MYQDCLSQYFCKVWYSVCQLSHWSKLWSVRGKYDLFGSLISLCKPLTGNNDCTSVTFSADSCSCKVTQSCSVLYYNLTHGWLSITLTLSCTYCTANEPLSSLHESLFILPQADIGLGWYNFHIWVRDIQTCLQYLCSQYHAI